MVRQISCRQIDRSNIYQIAELKLNGEQQNKINNVQINNTDQKLKSKMDLKNYFQS